MLLQFFFLNHWINSRVLVSFCPCTKFHTDQKVTFLKSEPSFNKENLPNWVTSTSTQNLIHQIAWNHTLENKLIDDWGKSDFFHETGSKYLMILLLLCSMHIHVCCFKHAIYQHTCSMVIKNYFKHLEHACQHLYSMFNCNGKQKKYFFTFKTFHSW